MRVDESLSLSAVVGSVNITCIIILFSPLFTKHLDVKIVFCHAQVPLCPNTFQTRSFLSFSLSTTFKGAYLPLPPKPAQMSRTLEDWDRYQQQL